MILPLSGMDKPAFIPGGSFADERGELCFVNEASLVGVQRFYILSNAWGKRVRAWQGHKKEAKYFFALEGSFLIAVIKIDDFANPSPGLKPDIYILEAAQPQILFVPAGHANGIQALSPANRLLVFSTLTLEESAADTYRFSPELWYDWNE